MLEMSACVEWLFAAEEADFAKRVGRAGEAGFQWVEFWTWRDKDLAEIAAALEASEVRLKSFVSQPEGQLVDPRTHAEFLGGVEDSARVAHALGAESLIVLSGDRLAGVDDRSQRMALIDGLCQGAALAAEHDVTLILEPLNTRIDHVGYFLEATRKGLDVVEEVASDNLKLLLDVYHAVVMGEVPQDVVGDRMELVGHVHFADVPGRNEPGTGRIDWSQIVAWLESSGYGGAVGLEYMPSVPRTVDSMALIASEVA